MQCAYHPGREPVGTCRECGRFICLECRNLLGGVPYCQPCSNKLFLNQESTSETIVPVTSYETTEIATQQSSAKAEIIERGFLKPWTRPMAIICSIILAVSIFLVWLSPSEKLAGLGTASGLNISPILTAAGIVAAIAIIASTILLKRKVRGIIEIIMGILAIAVLVLVILLGQLPLQSALVRTLVVIREGAILYALASIVILITGIMELSGRKYL